MNKHQLIRSTALQTITIEIEVLNDLKNSIDNDFITCVEKIMESSGRVIVTGIGKSAIIAKKIVATFNSTGTPSIFMHAADAIHGDLGMIRSDDIVLCLSKSGNTPEIAVLAPLIKNQGNLLIGMVANQDSFLAQQSDFLLYTPVSKEAEPNNLAPTASTTAQMAMGDALATALLALRGFTPNDFAQYHPGGMLGKQLYMTVQNVFANNAVPKVALEADLTTIILEITSKRLGATAVIDAQQHILGIITDGDLRRMLSQTDKLTTIKAKDIMSGMPKTIKNDALAIKAFEMMRQHSITQLIVVNNQQEYCGIIHLHDLIREGFV